MGLTSLHCLHGHLENRSVANPVRSRKRETVARPESLAAAKLDFEVGGPRTSERRIRSSCGGRLTTEQSRSEPPIGALSISIDVKELD
jgi:hypothetical protein